MAENQGWQQHCLQRLWSLLQGPWGGQTGAPQERQHPDQEEEVSQERGHLNRRGQPLHLLQLQLPVTRSYITVQHVGNLYLHALHVLHILLVSIPGSILANTANSSSRLPSIILLLVFLYILDYIYL